MDEVAALEKKIFKQEDTITDLQDKFHKTELKLCTVLGTLGKVETSQDELKNEITHHIHNEENAVKSIYERITKMDDELKESFEKRDTEITNLKITMAKLFAYGTVLYIIINTVVQVWMRTLP